MNARAVLYEAMLAGAADLDRRRALLDRINVFPVVDADTGKNLCRTVEALAASLRDGAADPGRAVMLGARGNSGIILAEYLVAFLDALDGDGPSCATGFSTALEKGASLARRAVAEPVEGTILTAMSALPEIVRSLGGIGDLAAHAELERRLAEIVADTPRRLPRLAEAGVVDAGALGFHVFACGLSLALPGIADPAAALAAIRDRREGRTTAPLGATADRIDPRFLADEARLKEADARFCVDAVIELSAEPPRDLVTRIAAFGASVDVARSGSTLKLHVHSDAPDSVRREVERYGRILSFDAEDLAAGLLRADPSDAAPDDAFEAAVRVVGDSAMSLSAELATRFGIARLENYVGARGAMVRDSRLDMSAMFSRMREGQPFSTAQASAAEAKAFVDAQLEKPGSIVYVAVGAAYTGTRELVRRALSHHPEKDRFEIVDTRAASGQQGLVALVTARRARAFSSSRDLAAYARRQAASCREYLVLETLEYLSRSGRVGRVKAALAGAFSVRPIVGHGEDGAITWAKVRSDEAAVHEVVGRVAAHPGDGPLVVLFEYTDNAERADALRGALEASLGERFEFFTSPLSATSSVHMGPGTWGLAVTRDFLP